MLTTSPAELLRLFWGGLFLGLAFAAVYDVLRITRVLMGETYGSRAAGRLAALPMPPAARTHGGRFGRRLRDLLVNLEDLLYFLCVGVTVAVYLSAANHGRVRWLAFAGIALGFLFWRLTAGRMIIACSAAIAALLRFAVGWILWCICRPFVWLGRLIAGRLRALWLWLYLPAYTRRTTRQCLRRLTRAFSKSEMEG